MSTFVRQLTCWSLVLFVLVSITPAAWAFYPIGGFNENGQLRYTVWPDFEFDTNNDGQILPEEGINYLVEGGPRGFNPEETAIIDAAFKVWQDIPSSYAAFRNDGTVIDPIFMGGDQPDFLTVIALQITDPGDSDTIEADPIDVILPGVSYPILGVTTILYTISDTVETFGNETVVISAGTMIDVDIIIDANAIRRQEGQVEPLADLMSVMVHEIGHFIGLDHTPLSNLRLVENAGVVEDLVENTAMQLTGPDGIARMIGVTPTMFPIYFEVLDEFGERHPGATDLAVDDISGASFLYPRGSQSQFFNLRHEARTKTRVGTGLPSLAIPGGNVTAWADTDNDVNTPRVPLFSTITGFWEPWVNVNMQGYFEMLGIWKRLEVPGTNGALFNVSYTFTLNPMNHTGFERQAPPGFFPTDFDSIQGPNSFTVSPRPSSSFNNAFQSETFHELDNITDVSNKDGGTPMVWDFSRNTLVSMDTGKTFAAMRTYKRPMFGDPNDVCPFNVIEGNTSTGTTTTTDTGGDTGDDTGDDDDGKGKAILVGAAGAGPGGPNMIRQFRDTVLMESALGVALVDTYYSVSPTMARFLLNHGWALNGSKTLVHGVYWVMNNAILLSILLSALLFGGVLFRRRRKALAVASLLFLLIATLFLTVPVDAQIAFMTSEDMLANSDAALSVKVISTEGRWANGGKIITDVVVQVDDSAKGGMKENSTLVFSVAGGRVGNLWMKVTEMPTFSAGDEMVIYLKQDNRYGYVLYGGLRSRLSVNTSKSDNKKYVIADNDIIKIALKEDSAAIDKESGEEDAEIEDNAVQKISLDKYMEYLKSIVKAQKAAEEK